VDVHFNSKNSSSPSDKAEYIRRDKSRPSSLAQRNGNDVENGEQVPDAEITGQLSNGSSHDGTALSTIFEESCQPTRTCDTSKPKCQVFPYDQANPADIAEESTNATAIMDATFDAEEEIQDYPPSNSDSSMSMPSTNWSSGIPTASSVTSASSGKSKQEQPSKGSWNDGLTHLDTLEYLMLKRPTSSSQANLSPSLRNLSLGDSHSGKARIKLQSQIQDLTHKLSAAHHTSSDTDPDDSAMALRGLRLSENRSRGIRLITSPLVARPLGCTKLVKRRQLELWRNYIDNIAPALDVCSNKRYFQHNLPMLAKSTGHLHYAVLALSSCQLFNQDPHASRSESQGLYQDAIDLLLPEIHTLDTATIATVLILCIMDILTSSANRYADSLKACAVLMDAADINARSGGLRQALFWCFANFAIWHDLSHPGTPSIIPTRSFYPTDALTTAVSYIRSLTLGDGYAKYIVYLTSIIVDNDSNRSSLTSNEHEASRQAQLSALTTLLADWANCRPEDMQPLMSYPSILDDEDNPFPMVLYLTVPAAIANLLHHCASILLLEQKSCQPKGADLGNTTQSVTCQPRSCSIKCSPPEQVPGKGVTWHARQICGILSESHEPAVLLHGRHALNIAGKFITSDTEKEAILALLDRMEMVWPSRLHEK
jgi:hypothetical protein